MLLIEDTPKQQQCRNYSTPVQGRDVYRDVYEMFIETIVIHELSIQITTLSTQ